VGVADGVRVNEAALTPPLPCGQKCLIASSTVDPTAGGQMLVWFVMGLLAWLVLRFVVQGFYTVGPNERAVITTLGRAQRVGTATTLDDPVAQSLSAEEAGRYVYPQVRVIGPGVHRRWPWQKVHKVSVATVIVSIAHDPDEPSANHKGTVLDAVTKDQLNTGFTGQLRYTISERNLYAYLFGVKNPVSHVMGYFVSVLRDRVANFSAPRPESDAAAGEEPVDLESVQGISINDLRKNLSDLNDHMNVECASAAARYGIGLDAVLITGIDPPAEIESALAAINTAHNQVSSSISLAHAAADQKIVQSRRAVEIETLNAQAEVEPLLAMATQLRELRSQGAGALDLYIRNVRLGLYPKAVSVITSSQDGRVSR
jgi:regulator of protease activity HflC (stomatin/prohibitin superfamily)